MLTIASSVIMSFKVQPRIERKAVLRSFRDLNIDLIHTGSITYSFLCFLPSGEFSSTFTFYTILQANSRFLLTNIADINYKNVH